MIRLLFALVLACAALSAQAAGLAASVDRTRLSLDETLELTLEARDAAVFGRPDLQPLNELFEVYDTRQLNSLSNVGGEAQAVTRWLTTLRPRRTGYLIIPSLQLGDWHSDPITVFVQEARGNHDSALLAPVFIDASVDRESVYVQAQIILTLRIYHSVSLYDDSTLSPLQMPDALVKRLGEPRTYEKDINGVRHGVIEVRYALFPQKSGRLQIPSQLFSATTVASGNDYSILGPRPGRSAQVKSPTIPVEVKPKPRDYPTDAPWLPATPARILDLCTGSGCIGIACAYAFEQAEVVLADLSFDALEVANVNIERHDLGERVYTVQGDGFAGLPGQRFDLIVSNPPYVDAEDFADMPAEFHHEPELGLACGDDGLDLVRRMLAEAADHLSEKGLLIVEVGNSEVHVQALYPEVDFTWLEFEHGGHGVFMLSAAQCREHRELFRSRLEK